MNGATADMGAFLHLPLVRDLMSCAAVRRLDNVRFLGAIDYFAYGRDIRHPHGFSRLEHSLGVAALANSWAELVELGAREHLTLIAAAILHDAGHGPLSHSSEYFFARKFGLNHHKSGQRLLSGEHRFSRELLACLHDHRIEVEDVWQAAFLRRGSPLSFMFAGPLNVDSLDGVLRTAKALGIRSHLSESILVSSVASLSDASVFVADDFWKLKQLVYAVIQNAENSAKDLTVSLALELAHDRVTVADYELDDDAFLERFASELDSVRRMRQDAAEKFSAAIDRESHAVKKRPATIKINKAVSFKSIQDMHKRYYQSSDGAPWPTTPTSNPAVSIQGQNLNSSDHV